MRKITHYTIWFLILIFAFSLAGSVQAQIDIWKEGPMIRIGKKPKDFNKPPDTNEFQKPTNGEFKANPLFFAAKDDKERCQAIDLWLSSVRYEVNQAYARSTYYRQNTEFDMEKVNGNEIPQFATPGFRNIFGKALPELSEKETKQIGKFLDKCTTQRWVAIHLEPLFKSPYPSQMGEWFRNFANYESALQQAKVEAEKENYRRKYQNTVSSSGYPVAELLKETESYRLHTSFLSNGSVEWCSANGNQAVVGLIFKANENFRIENNEQYWRLFDSEILPAVKSSCPIADKVYVLNYINGFYINFDQNKINTSPIYNYPSNMLNIGVYSASTNSRSWMGGSSNFGGSGYSGGRTQRETPLRNTDSDGTPSFASITNLRAELQVRQAKIDEEARIRREQAAAAEAARIAEAKRQADIKNASRRAEDRSRASEILKFYKKGAIANYDFSEFSSRKMLQNIYQGDFSDYTGGYQSWTEATKSVSSTFRDADVRNPFGFLLNLIGTTVEVSDVRSRRDTINLIFYSYHNVYKDVCSNSTSIPWTKSERWVFYVTRNDVKVEGSETVGVSILIRKPYKELYDRIYGNLGNTRNVNPDIPQSYIYDFQKLLKTEGCASASIRHFETNLYLATIWSLPIQELQKP
jgi:hypothetical protein